MDRLTTKSDEVSSWRPILIKLHPDSTDIFHRKYEVLIQKYEWSFTMVKRIEKLTYKLDLILGFKIHSIFHIYNMEPFYINDEDSRRSEP